VMRVMRVMRVITRCQGWLTTDSLSILLVRNGERTVRQVAGLVRTVSAQAHRSSRHRSED
jgi:hypothetical protein